MIDKDHRIIAEGVPEEYTLIFSIEVALRDWLGEHEEEAPKHVPREVSALRRKKRKREARWPMLSEVRNCTHITHLETSHRRGRWRLQTEFNSDVIFTITTQGPQLPECRADLNGLLQKIDIIPGRRRK